MSILLIEDFTDINTWVDADSDTGVSEISPAGQLRLDTNTGAAGDAVSARYKVIPSPPDIFSIETKTYFDALGTLANADFARLIYSTATWGFYAEWCSDGLYIVKTSGGRTEVGVNIVLCNAGAAWQTWRFQINKTGGETAATVEVFLEEVSQGTVDCDFEIASTNGFLYLVQYGYTTNDMVSHYNYIKIATVLGGIQSPQILTF